MDWDLIKRKSKWKPPKPNFHDYNTRTDTYSITKSDFNEWYDKEVKPLFENAVEMWGYSPFPYKDHPSGNYMEPMNWRSPEIAKKRVDDGDEMFLGNHKALLIKIEPIKQETAESLLREIANFHDQSGIIEYKSASPPIVSASLVSRIKRFLDKKK